MFRTILCRYNEIATKGNNRYLFENRLMDNLRFLCGLVCPCKVGKIRGRIMIHKKDETEFNEFETRELTDKLKCCFGLESFSFCLTGEPSLESLKQLVALTAPEYFQRILREQGVRRVEFRTRARRADKRFPLDSKGIEIEIATLVESLIGQDKVKVNLEHPALSIGVEMREEGCMVYYDSIPGPGGLPVGSNPPVLTLLSGGIDSPVAATMIMKRGCRSEFLTFHSFPYTPMESVDKVRRLAEIVCRYQKGGTLYACNIAPVQKLIRDNCNARYRTVLYRRMMMRIAAKICSEYGLCAVVTGESAGQVASQTLENMSVIDGTIPYLILRPLCGMDKNETIARARQLNTFDVSIEPMADSCTVFAPDNPVLHSKPEDVLYQESRIPGMEEALEDAFRSMEVIPIIRKPVADCNAVSGTSGTESL